MIHLVFLVEVRNLFCGLIVMLDLSGYPKQRAEKKFRSCQLYLYFNCYLNMEKYSQFYDTIWKKFKDTLLIFHSYKIILKLHGNSDLHKLLGCDLSLQFLILG